MITMKACQIFPSTATIAYLKGANFVVCASNNNQQYSVVIAYKYWHFNFVVILSSSQSFELTLYCRWAKKRRRKSNKGKKLSISLPSPLEFHCPFFVSFNSPFFFSDIAPTYIPLSVARSLIELISSRTWKLLFSFLLKRYDSCLKIKMLYGIHNLIHFYQIKLEYPLSNFNLASIILLLLFIDVVKGSTSLQGNWKLTQRVNIRV